VGVGEREEGPARAEEDAEREMEDALEPERRRSVSEGGEVMSRDDELPDNAILV
jgi:hypothetical protein